MSEEEDEKDRYPQTWTLTFMANLMLQRDISENSARSELPPSPNSFFWPILKWTYRLIKPVLVKAIYSFPIKLEAFIWSSKILNTIFLSLSLKSHFLCVLSILIIYLTNVFLITQLLYYIVSTYKCLRSEICLGKKLFYSMYNVISSQIII